MHSVYPLCLWFFLAAASSAADAVFDATGQRLWHISPNAGEVAYLDLDDPEATEPSARVLDLKPSGIVGYVLSLGRSNKGNLLLASANELWAYNAGEAKAARVAAFQDGFSIADFAYDPVTGGILLWGYKGAETAATAEAYWIPAGQAPATVALSGVHSLAAAAFAPDGRLYFVDVPGDLWVGEVSAPEHDLSGDFAWQIWGYRLAPLAAPMSGEAAGAGKSIATILPSAKLITLVLSSTDESSLVQVIPPAAKKREDGRLDRAPTLAARWAQQAAVIKSAVVLKLPHALPRFPRAALTPDGQRLAYQTAEPGLRTWWLRSPGSAPRVILKESD